MRMLALDKKCHLGHFQKLGYSVHPNEEFLVQIQGISGLLLLHLKVLLEKIDNSVVVASKQSYQVSEQQHEAGIDHSVIQILQIRDLFSLSLLSSLIIPLTCSQTPTEHQLGSGAVEEF